MKKKIYLVLGLSACGKDSLVNAACSALNKKKIISYATRPQRVGEKNTHIFIKPEDVDKYRNDIIAYTKIGDIEYFATASQLDDCDFYIIDPDGVDCLMNNKALTKKYEFIIIFINVDEKILKQRSVNRGDNPEVYQKRHDAEIERFDAFYKNRNKFKRFYVFTNSDDNFENNKICFVNLIFAIEKELVY